MNFRISLSVSTKKPAGISTDQAGEHGHLKTVLATRLWGITPCGQVCRVSLQCVPAFSVQGCAPLARFILNRFIVFWRCCKGNCKFLSWRFVAAEVRNPRISRKGAIGSSHEVFSPGGCSGEAWGKKREDPSGSWLFFYISASNCLPFLQLPTLCPVVYCLGKRGGWQRCFPTFWGGITWT